MHFRVSFSLKKLVFNHLKLKWKIFYFFEKICLSVKKSVVLLPSLSRGTKITKRAPPGAEFIDILKPSSKETYEKPLFYFSFEKS